MALYFEKVSLVSYSHRPVSLDAGLRYRLEKNITIQGVLRDNHNQEGANALVAKEKLIIDGAIDYQDIILNGISFGAGYVTNVEFAGGALVRNETYTYNIICYENGNLFNATNGVYAGITWPSANLIENIDESFSYEEDEEGNKTYNHSISVKYTRYSTVVAGINLAKVLATEFFAATSGLATFLNSYANIGAAKKIYNESYSLVDCSCSFDESITIHANKTGNYSYNLSYSVQQDAQGYVSVEESVSIKGLTNPKYAGAAEGLAALRASAYTRANAVYTYYNWSSTGLYGQPIEVGISTNKFEGTIELTSTFSNDPKYQNYAIWSYEQELTLDENNYYEISERGTIIGMGRALAEKYTNALNFYNNNVKSPAVDTRIATLYATTGRTETLYLKTHSFSKDDFAGIIEYRVTKTDNNTFSTGNLKSSIIRVETSNPVHLFKNYNVFNYKEIIQTQNQSTLGQRTIDVQLKGKRGLSLATFLTEAKALAATYIPSQTDKFIDSARYDWDPQNNSFNLNTTFLFVGTYKTKEDLSVNV